jgi:PhzF family phenazine biosynthesis protein
MKLPIYQVDAFASQVFAGNPAALVPLETWLPDATLQAIAAENNLSETAYFVGGDGAYALRWFTPTTEIDLCGHATLASAFLILNRLEKGRDRVTFGSKSGPLVVTRDGERLVLDFPARPPKPVAPDPRLADALHAVPRETGLARDLMVVLDSEDEVRRLRPDFQRLSELDAFAVMVTAAGREADFVSRFFAPREGIAEDPVTGSAHCTLVPYWAKRLGKTRLRALQVSARGGELFCEDRGERVAIAGHAVLYMEGTIEV